MKTIVCTGTLALVVLFALAIGLEAPAFATEILWLSKGSAIVTTKPSESNGEITIGNLKTPVLGEVAMLCSVFFDSDTGPGFAQEVAEVLTLSGGSISLTTQLACTNVKNCENPRVSFLNFPWETTLVLMGTEASPLFLNLYFGKGPEAEPGWEIDCTSILGLTEETCTGQFSANVETIPAKRTC